MRHYTLRFLRRAENGCQLARRELQTVSVACNPRASAIGNVQTKHPHAQEPKGRRTASGSMSGLVQLPLDNNSAHSMTGRELRAGPCMALQSCHRLRADQGAIVDGRYILLWHPDWAMIHPSALRLFPDMGCRSFAAPPSCEQEAVGFHTLMGCSHQICRRLRTYCTFTTSS